MKYIVLFALSNFLALHALTAQTKLHSIYFCVHLDKSLRKDTLILKYWPYVLDDVNLFLPCKQQSVAIDKNGNYVFQMDSISKEGYISLTNGVISSKGSDYYWLLSYYCEPGDSIQMNIHGDSAYLTRINVFPEKFSIDFSGRGYLKYQCRNLIDKTSYATGGENAYLAGMKILLSYKSKLAPHVHQIIKADVMGNAEYQNFRRISYNVWKYLTEMKTDSAKITFENYGKDLSKEMHNNPIADSIKAFSNMYGQFLFNYNRLKYKLSSKEVTNRYESFYEYLKNEFKGPLRDRLLTMSFLVSGKFTKEDKPPLKDALTIVRNNIFHKQLQQLLVEHSGNYAYNFGLPDTSDKIVHLTDFRGKVVVIDFWYTGCVACYGYYQTRLKYVEDKFKNNKEVVFIAISIDNDKNKWLSSIRTEKYTSPYVVNLFTNGEGYNHKVIQMYNIYGYPSPLIINRQGEIYKFDSPELRDTQTMIEAINAALNT